MTHFTLHGTVILMKLIGFSLSFFILFAASATLPVEKLNLPAGFKIKLYAVVPGARSMTVAPNGTLFVGTGGYANALDRVYRIRDWNGNKKIDEDEVEVFIEKLNNPNGVAIRNGLLYVAEATQILEFKDVLTAGRHVKLTKDKARVLPQTFPAQKGHEWKFIRFAPKPNDHFLYVPVGAPCNICKIKDPYAAIHRIDVTSDKPMETVARGVRNTVGFDFHPDTGNLWFTDNGRDLLGDDLPPDELNELSKTGEHFGYPFCHGAGIADPEIKFEGDIKSCADTTAVKVPLAPHAASLGMRFYLGKRFPPQFRKQIYIAEHGSWNRSKKSGYRVSTVAVINGKLTYQPFVTGWLDENSQNVWGRPVDIQELSDGSLLISDDGIPNAGNPGAIYRVSYEN
jgi:glucose/arabinose dehydrogenase